MRGGQWGQVSDAHGHMSGPSDLRGLRRTFCSLSRGHDLLTCSRAHRAVYTCVCVREWTQKMPWPGPEGLVSKDPFRVPELGTPGSASLTNLEPDLGRSAEVSLAVAWEPWKGEPLHCPAAQSAGGPGPARKEDRAPGGREGLGNGFPGMGLRP